MERDIGLASYNNLSIGYPQLLEDERKGVERDVCLPAQAPEEAENVLSVLQVVEHVVGHLLRGEGQAAQAHSVQVPVVMAPGRANQTGNDRFCSSSTDQQIYYQCFVTLTDLPPPSPNTSVI